MMDFSDYQSVVDKINDVREIRLCSLKRIGSSQRCIVKWIFAALILYLLIGINDSSVMAGEVQQLNYFPTWSGGIIPSTDASGICYHAPSGHLYITDSEIDENAEWNGFNIFETSLLGDTLFNSYDSVGRGNYREPVGITYNSFDGYFYIVDDNTRDIYRFDPTFGNFIAYVHVQNDVPDAGDPEGITSDPATGHLYVIEGTGGGKQVLAYNSNLQFLYRFYIDPSIHDPNGIAFDPKSNHLFIMALEPGPDILYEYTLDGTYIDQYSLDGLSPQAFKPQGVVFAPPSDPNSDPDDLSLYIVDMELNNAPDGGVYEVKLLCTPTAEICDNLDNDCDGSVDEDVTRQTTCGLGECASTGIETCAAGIWGADTCIPGEPSAELCDGKDNDCDAAADDGSDESWYGVNCDGPDEDLCEEGIFECINALMSCSDVTGDAVELCSDGTDNDCDGLVDEPNIPESFEVNIYPVADTSVNIANQSRIYGTEPTIEIDGSPERIGYLKFDLTGISGTVQSARLGLNVVNRPSSSGGTIHSISDNSWDENTVNYGTRPSVDGPVLDAVGTVNVGDNAEFDVSAAIGENGIYSFAIVSDDSDKVEYRSREDLINPPVMFITVNEPGIGFYCDDDLDGHIDLTGDGSYFTNGCVPPECLVMPGGDCDDGNSVINPDSRWYRDSDGDGYGDPTISVTQCTQPPGPSNYVLDNTDYDDSDPNIYPGGPWVRVVGTITSYHLTLQDAYNNAENDAIIQVHATTITEMLNFNINKSVTIEGGCSNDFKTIISTTTLVGHMTINNGTLTMDNFILQ